MSSRSQVILPPDDPEKTFGKQVGRAIASILPDTGAIKGQAQSAYNPYPKGHIRPAAPSPVAPASTAPQPVNSGIQGTQFAKQAATEALPAGKDYNNPSGFSAPMKMSLPPAPAAPASTTVATPSPVATPTTQAVNAASQRNPEDVARRAYEDHYLATNYQYNREASARSRSGRSIQGAGADSLENAARERANQEWKNLGHDGQKSFVDDKIANGEMDASAKMPSRYEMAQQGWKASSDAQTAKDAYTASPAGQAEAKQNVSNHLASIGVNSNNTPEQNRAALQAFQASKAEGSYNPGKVISVETNSPTMSSYQNVSDQSSPNVSGVVAEQKAGLQNAYANQGQEFQGDSSKYRTVKNSDGTSTFQRMDPRESESGGGWQNVGGSSPAGTPSKPAPYVPEGGTINGVPSRQAANEAGQVNQKSTLDSANKAIEDNADPRQKAFDPMGENMPTGDGTDPNKSENPNKIRANPNQIGGTTPALPGGTAESTAGTFAASGNTPKPLDFNNGIQMNTDTGTVGDNSPFKMAAATLPAAKESASPSAVAALNPKPVMDMINSTNKTPDASSAFNVPGMNFGADANKGQGPINNESEEEKQKRLTAANAGATAPTPPAQTAQAATPTTPSSGS